MLLLKEVVLDVLLDAQSEGMMLQPKEINERIGIPDTKAERYEGRAYLSSVSFIILRLRDVFRPHTNKGATSGKLVKKKQKYEKHENNEMPLETLITQE